MYKLLYIVLVSLIVANCSFKPVVKHHGIPFLEKKSSKLVVNESNKNDVKNILGNPAIKSKFDNDVWIRLDDSKQHYEYVCTHVDDFMICSKNPERIMEDICSVYKVKESSKGEPSYYLGNDYKRDKKNRWCIGCKTYLTEAIHRIEELFGES